MPCNQQLDNHQETLEGGLLLSKASNMHNTDKIIRLYKTKSFTVKQAMAAGGKPAREVMQCGVLSLSHT
jgi:hypothetical protein